jgi:hypothetical protein
MTVRTGRTPRHATQGARTRAREAAGTPHSVGVRQGAHGLEQRESGALADAPIVAPGLAGEDTARAAVGAAAVGQQPRRHPQQPLQPLVRLARQAAAARRRVVEQQPPLEGAVVAADVGRVALERDAARRRERVVLQCASG